MIANSSQATAEVLEIGKLHIEGNVIPHNWYQNIKGPTGKTDLEAIIILSEILYWYRPTYIKDESSGQVIGIKKKFKADALQRTKKSFAEQFGLTERKVQESLALLEKLGLITRDYRTVLHGDVVCSNVLFIKIHPERIKEVTFKNVIAMAEFCHTPPTNSTIPLAEIGHTYTDNTPQITTDTNTPPIPPHSGPPDPPASPKPAKAGGMDLEVSKSFSEEVKKVGQEMVAILKTDKPTYKVPSNLTQWYQAIDLMIRSDHRQASLIIKVFAWAVADEFWKDKMFKPNPAKYLRTMFDQLETKMNAKPMKNPNRVDRRTKDADGNPIYVKPRF